MTKVYVDDTASTTVFAANTVYTVQVASAASDTTVTTSGTGNSLINTSVGGAHVLNSVAAGANVTITSDSAGTLTIAATEDNLSNNTTSDLTEGTNLYYTDARVMTSLATVSGDIIPDGHKTRDMGSTTNAWKSVYVGDGSLYIDGTKVLGSDATGQIDFTTDSGQNLNFQAGGTITMLSAGLVTTLGDSTVNLGPSVGGGTINARGTLEAPDVHIGSLELESGLINSTGSNQNLEIRSNGTGYVHFNTADVYIGSPITTAVKIDGTSITTTAGNLTISATGTVDVAGHYTSAETDTAISTATTGSTSTAESKDAVRATAANAYADAAVAVLTSGASATHDTLLEIQNLMATDAELSSAISGLNHDALAGFVANEHIDWTVTGNTVHADNYTNTDTDTIFTSANAITAVEGEATLDLTGAITIPSSKTISSSTTDGNLTLNSNGTGLIKLDNLEISNANSGWGESQMALTTPTDDVLLLSAPGSAGYIMTSTPGGIWFGDGTSGAFLKSASGAASEFRPWGGQNLEIGPRNHYDGSVMTVSLEGDLTADTTNTKRILSNRNDLTIPGIPEWGGWNMFTGGSGIGSTINDGSQTGGGYPFVGIARTNNINVGQPTAQYLINYMDYDITPGLAGHGVQMNFAAQTETGKHIDIASNLCKIRDYTSSGSAGSSTIDSWDSEYTLTVMSNTGSGYTLGTNVLTTNVDFTEVAQELRVVNKSINSGSTSLSGLYLTYTGAETGTPTAKIQLRNEGTGTSHILSTLEETRVTQEVIHKQYKASSDPSGEAGDMYFNTATAKFRGYDGTNWTDLN